MRKTMLRRVEPSEASRARQAVDSATLVVTRETPGAAPD